MPTFTTCTHNPYAKGWNSFTSTSITRMGARKKIFSYRVSAVPLFFFFRRIFFSSSVVFRCRGRGPYRFASHHLRVACQSPCPKKKTGCGEFLRNVVLRWWWGGYRGVVLCTYKVGENFSPFFLFNILLAVTTFFFFFLLLGVLFILF